MGLFKFMINKEIQQKEREKILNQAVIYSSSNKYLALLLATGVGKSFISLFLGKLHKAKKILIIHYETNHKDNWIDEINKHGFDLSNYTFTTYASLNKIKESYDYIIADEAHHFTESKLKHLITLSFNRISFLTATLNKEKKELLHSFFSSTKYYKVSLKEAIERGILPEPKIYLHGIELDRTNESESINKVRGKQEKRKKITLTFQEYVQHYMFKAGNYEFHITCTPFEKYIFLSQEFDGEWNNFMKNRQDYQKFKALKIASSRKRYLADCKTDKAKEIISSFNSRYIVFTGSIQQAKDLGGDEALHSKLTTKEAKKMINSYNEGNIDALYCVKKLREGQNLSDVRYGLIVQLDNQLSSFLQICGRLLRNDFPEIHVIYVKNTQDEKYLETCLEGINKNWIYEL